MSRVIRLLRVSLNGFSPSSLCFSALKDHAELTWLCYPSRADHRGASSLVFWGFLCPNSWTPNKGKGKSKHLEISQCSSSWLRLLLGWQHSRFTQRRGHPATAQVPRTTSRYPFANCKLGFLQTNFKIKTHRHVCTVYTHLPHSPAVFSLLPLPRRGTQISTNNNPTVPWCLFAARNCEIKKMPSRN